MNMIWHQMSFNYFNTFITAQLFYNISDIRFILIINYFSSILWCEYDTIFNHTDLYEYKHGKMLIHLHFAFCRPILSIQKLCSKRQLKYLNNLCRHKKTVGHSASFRAFNRISSFSIHFIFVGGKSVANRLNFTL